MILKNLFYIKMKTISELRKSLPDRLQNNLSSSIKYLNSQNIDFDVYLPSINKNLQRKYCWNIDQKRELIWSIFYNRYIPSFSFINTFNETWQVIDGKQRLSTLLDFYNDKFTVIIESEDFFYSTLPRDYKDEITRYYINYTVYYEIADNVITDEMKINWFKYINFAGVPQDIEHMNSLKID